jgi:hypothetical protein
VSTISAICVRLQIKINIQGKRGENVCGWEGEVNLWNFNRLLPIQRCCKLSSVHSRGDIVHTRENGMRRGGGKSAELQDSFQFKANVLGD